MVQEWYIKKSDKQLIWVKWREPFQDEHEKDDAYFTSWSAEDQKILMENPSNRAAVEQVNYAVTIPLVIYLGFGVKDYLAMDYNQG